VNNITYIVKCFNDKHGDMRPINYSDCPKYQQCQSKEPCFDSILNRQCSGIIIGKTLQRDIDKNLTIIECRYSPEKII